MFQNIPKTELLYQKSKPIDQLSVSEGISLMVEEQKKSFCGGKKSCQNH